MAKTYLEVYEINTARNCCEGFNFCQTNIPKIGCNVGNFLQYVSGITDKVGHHFYTQHYMTHLRCLKSKKIKLFYHNLIFVYKNYNDKPSTITKN
jgi:hypothetical protein